MKNTIKGLIIAVIGLIVGMITMDAPVEKVVAKEVVHIESILHESTDDFYISDGEIGVELSDGSWVSANPKTNEYTFQPVDLGDWSYEVDSLKKLENIVDTYVTLKNSENLLEKHSKVYIDEIEYIEQKGLYVTYSDGSWSLESQERGVYIFQPVDLADWCYELSSTDELNSITRTYMSLKNTGSY